MKIFIIDDEEVNLFLTQQMLVKFGPKENIHTFVSAEEALGSIQAAGDEDIPDVILLDLNMPVINGWEFLDVLKPQWERLRKKCKIYILTSSLNYADEAAAKDHSMISGIIHKPITLESLGIIS